MFKRVRQLRIPLAAKCELLFGAAVVLVISAALLVPWQRMEQLTEQLNEKAAAAVARHAVGEHVLRYSSASRAREGTTTETTASTPTTNVVETVAHMMSAVHFFGDIDVVCDIGGQSRSSVRGDSESTI